MSGPGTHPAREGVRPVTVRNLVAEDRDAVIAIDAQHTGERKPGYWEEVFGRFTEPSSPRRVGLGAQDESGRLVGYVLGEVRAFEFGSEACGWIFSLAVAPSHLRARTASRLLAEAGERFRAVGMTSIRTMVRRNDIPVLSFFRAAGFEGGSFVQLEKSLGGES